MHWAEIKVRQPGLAELGARCLLDPGVVLVVTIRRDGTPRLSPVEPFVLDDGLWLSMMWESRKAADLRRDQLVAMWPPAREFIRRNETATSLANAEPTAGILRS
jgi:hypothetical protein